MRWLKLVPITLLAACRQLSGEADPIPPPPPTPVPTTFAVPGAELPSPLAFIVYGDMRFTNPAETEATSPAARRALVERVAAEQPAALFLTGDLPWHGVQGDYDEYRAETRLWRQEQLKVYPALGNHEFSQCAVAECLSLWWGAFPELSGRRWYSVALGERLRALALDSDAPLTPGSEQRAWLEAQLEGLSPRVQVVLLVMHHPPIADPIVGGGSGDHRVRPNEEALATYLAETAGHLSARLVVAAGHIHNYERFEQAGVTYLVSGGGGARPYEVARSAADRYQDPAFPNYHYLRFELRPRTLVGQMMRLALKPDGTPIPDSFEEKDRFEISLPP